MEKSLWPKGNIVSWFIVPMEKARFYKRLFFKVVIAMVKVRNTVLKDTMSIKTSFIYYIQWTRVTLPVVFVEFEMVYMFLLYFFFFSLSLSIGKRSNIAKIQNLGRLKSPAPPAPTPWFLRACIVQWFRANKIPLNIIKTK